MLKIIQENQFDCPECRQIIDISTNRIIVESCGHRKCRNCFIHENNGCAECHRSLIHGKSANITSTNIEPIDYIDQTIISAKPSTLPTLIVQHIIKPASNCNSHFDDTIPVTIQQHQQTTIVEGTCKKPIHGIKTLENILLKEPAKVVTSSTIKFETTQQQLILTNQLDDGDGQNGATYQDKLNLGHSETTVETINSTKKNWPTFIYPKHLIVKTIKEKTLYFCKICHKQFKNRNNRKYHLNCTSSNESKLKDTIKCTKCEKLFISQKQLTQHNKKHHQERSVHEINNQKSKCSNCNKYFATKNALKKHEKLKHKSIYLSETGIDESTFFNYECNNCSEKFLYKDQLIVHQRKHNADEDDNLVGDGNGDTSVLPSPFKCSHCDKNFLLKFNLNQHLQIHLDIKNYSCHQCKKRFTRKSALKTHLLSHSPNRRPFECAFCLKTFVDQRNLDRHNRIHMSSKKQFECTICKIKTGRKDAMIRHLRNLHPNIKFNEEFEKIVKNYKLSSVPPALIQTSTSTLTTDTTTTIFSSHIYQQNQRGVDETVINKTQPNVRTSVIQFIGRSKSPSNTSTMLPALPLTPPLPAPALKSNSASIQHQKQQSPIIPKPLDSIKVYRKLISPYFGPTHSTHTEIQQKPTPEQLETYRRILMPDVGSRPSTKQNIAGVGSGNDGSSAVSNKISDSGDNHHSTISQRQENSSINSGIIRHTATATSNGSSSSVNSVLKFCDSSGSQIDKNNKEMTVSTQKQSSTVSTIQSRDFAEIHWRKRTSQSFCHMEL